MTTDLFARPGQFYRGNLHTHSTRSDGALEPDDVCRRYQAEGYDFIALTDHFVGTFGYPIVDTTPFRREGFTTLLGAELHSGAMENGELWHILAVGLPPDFAPSNTPGNTPIDDQESGPEIARRARDAGAYVAVAHPEWSGMTTADARSIDAAHAVEIYNHGCAVDCDRPHGFYTLDQLLTEGRRLTLCATDDAHFSTPDAFGGWVMVKAETLAPDALLAALKAGHFYASTGPKIHSATWTADSVTITCDPAISVIVQGPGTATTCVRGDALTQATLPLDRFRESPWVRVSIIDAQGKRAWLNPVFDRPA